MLTTTIQSDTITSHIPTETQDVLLLRAPRQPYEFVENWPRPQIESENEVLIRIKAIGLNPVDWKSADYNFALPTLPAINGRDLAGTIVRTGSAVSKFKIGDQVFAPSTQYRDYRTSAFQQYAVLPEHCVAKVPSSTKLHNAAAIGVGAVTAALAIGSALGIEFEGFSPRKYAIGADGEELAWSSSVLSEDIGLLTDKLQHSAIASTDAKLHDENDFEPINSSPKEPWLLIWGGGTVSGHFAAQFARLAGLKVIAVANATKHSSRLKAVGVDHVIDRLNPEEAVVEIRRLTNGDLLYAVDCVGSKTAAFAIQCLDTTSSSQIVGLSGLPKTVPPNVKPSTVPIKTFHTNPRVGSELTSLLTRLLEEGKLQAPCVEVIEGGLQAVNSGLDRLRRNGLDFGRLVVKMQE
ncbi:oxidoreductase [Sistotremastrum suecicum HHB10207 ss-3]|uniref:Oxidoreductase n=1 Tax=Sistotremastrum suecicum HHB10207 ss-3 TaxID=1314776 RepID=A0A166GJF9_9AGAM|nr:oxidoreductase [Sistotremastrum suecicum HHB10207 ss-3]